MNKALLKNYAPQARQDFIAAVIARAQRIGITEKSISPAEKIGDLVIISGQNYPAKFGQKRDKLVARIEKDGFAQTMETIAYTWFNRFAALRYLEIHDYLPHGHRVLSSKDGVVPDILTHAADIAQNGDLADLNAAEVIDMKLAGDKDGELYRLMLLAQCNTLSNSMPFLFEKIDDETELLLPDNLLLTDSVIAKLVAAIPEENWQEIEVIGWLYQFYISERQREVIGKVVKSEDIPAATQLFTPNWIVKYLVQNSVGRLWSMANPNSGLKTNWDYYIEPAEQSPEVQAQLSQLMQTRLDENSGSLNPETLKILDPACGSGHILVEAYDILKDIYLERGYRWRDIPRLILEKNLYGLDIDDRAAQLAGFALLMKARADDRDGRARILDNPPKLNILALKESGKFDVASDENSELATHYATLITLFKHAKTVGSLIQIPADLAAQLPTLEADLTQNETDLLGHVKALHLLPLVQQAKLLSMQFDVVVANPPYMGGKGQNAELKDFAKKNYPDTKSDSFAMFMERCKDFTITSGELAFITPYVWMFTSSYEKLREKLLTQATISTLIQLEYNAFEPACIPVCAFTFNNSHINDYVGSYIKLSDFKGHENQAPKTLEAIKNPNCGWFYNAKPDDFKKISGSPIAYWVSDKVRDIFAASKKLGDIADARQGLSTADNDKFLRLWHEVNINQIGFGMRNREQAKKSLKKWFPHNKGGEFRKWYGNNQWVINWENDGQDLEAFKPKSVIRNPNYYFKPAVTWSDVTSSANGFRYCSEGFIPNTIAPVVYTNSLNDSAHILSFCNTNFASSMVKILNPTMHFHIGYFELLPYANKFKFEPSVLNNLIGISKTDWNNYETSWDFMENPLIRQKQPTLKAAFEQWQTENQAAFAEMKRLEEENNRLFIEAYGLQDELTPDVPDEQITLVRADREKDSVRLVSYALGCMMGRYSLDKAGLIYANAGNVDFDDQHYQTFAADNDGILPITDEFWFENDAAQRLNDFIKTVWGAESLENNVRWLAENLGQKTSETSEETLRRYLASNFYKDHLQTYKKRPIYWLFSSGKQGAFQALVYLHRYNESTLAKMRNNYVVPLMGRLQNRIEMLEKDRDAATSPASKNKIGKEIERFNKKKIELTAFDEKLRHYADMRISLDLDDGVKVNYGKFGDLLAEVKKVTGGNDDD